MAAIRRDLLLAIGLMGLLFLAVWAVVLVATGTVNQLLRQDAEAAGEAWARYLAANVTDLEAIVAGGAPSAESMAFFEKAQAVGDVFLYKIFDAQGVLRLSSDKLDQVGKAAGSMPVHNPEAAEVVLNGETEVEAKEGASPDRPAFYAEAYVPVARDGAIVGIVETYVDQSKKHAEFRTNVAGAVMALAGIVGVAVGLPAFGFYWRTGQKRQADSRVEFLAHHDPLTGLVNRARFVAELDEALAIGCPLAVHVIDIDRFKEANEAFGHAAGDEILRQAAARLKTLCRGDDLLARLGGDEFALAQVIREPAQVEAFAGRLSAICGEPFHLKQQDVASSASIGTAIAPAHGATAAELMKSADIALSHSKSEGLGGRSQFRPEMMAELTARRTLEEALRQAVSNDGFELHFQPIHRFADHSLVGFEALLRLPDAGYGAISPAVFIPLAERLGLIGAIGDWVIRRACETAADWPEPLTVAVNLSPAQFTDGRIAEKVGAALAAAGLAAGRLEIEITEGLLLNDSDAVLRQLGELKALGVGIAMDDFGTGYSSLSYLWKFPFDKLKIDQSFARGLGGDDRHVASVIRAIVALGRQLGMTITAEGVETRAQAAFLREVGCDQLQGFYMGRPMPAEQLPALVLRNVQATMRTGAASVMELAAARG
jgi:diguanylate cyclase (GGDEF)-like protein